MKEYKKLASFIVPQIWLLLLGIMFALMAQAFQGVSVVGTVIPMIDKIVANKEISLAAGSAAPRFLQDVVNKANSMPRVQLVNILIALFMIGFLLKPTFEFIHSYIMNKLSERIMRNIRDKVFKKLLTLSVDFYSKTPTGKLVSRLTYDVVLLKNSITQGLISLIMEPAKILIYAAAIIFVKMYFSISWRWVIISFILIPAIIYPVMVIGKKLRKIALRMQEKMGDINMIVYEAISGIRIVKSFRMEKYEENRFYDQNRNFYRMSMKSIRRMLVVRPITEWAAVLCVGLLLWVGKDELLSGAFSFGAFTALIWAILSMMKPIKALSRVYGVIQQALAASSRIFEILDAEPAIKEKPGAIALAPIKKRIIFKNVSFKYEESGYILSDINLEVKKGDILAIVGPSGAGKTTLINLIPRFYDVTGGVIEIDGVDVRGATLESLRGQIGVVTQDIVLFNDTVKFNIAYGMGLARAEEKKIIEAAKAANAHEFIKELPQGYDTLIGEKGVRLSGGQKQRLAIARALFKNPPILILDEATSQLDTDSEKLVQDALNRLMRGRTVFVIAHRLSTIKNATSIITLEEGIIKEAGTHSELMKEPTTYKRLYELQFKE